MIAVIKYDGKKIFEKFMRMGAASSMPKIRKWLRTEENITVSQMGPIWAMWKYATQNPEEAFPLYKVWHFEYWSNVSVMGKIIDSNVYWQSFLKDCQYRIKKSGDSIMSKTAYKRFCNKYGLEE